MIFDVQPLIFSRYKYEKNPSYITENDGLLVGAFRNNESDFLDEILDVGGTR